MAGITFPRHSYNLIKLFYLDNQVSGYVPEIFRIRNLQNELIFIIFLQSIRTCRMSSQDICTLGIQLNFFRCTNINLSKVILIDVTILKHLLFLEETGICQNILILQFFSLFRKQTKLCSVPYLAQLRFWLSLHFRQ